MLSALPDIPTYPTSLSCWEVAFGVLRRLGCGFFWDDPDALPAAALETKRPFSSRGTRDFPPAPDASLDAGTLEDAFRGAGLDFLVFFFAAFTDACFPLFCLATIIFSHRTFHMPMVINNIIIIY
jgi:hypothetical protein